jgi:hypothetical protein
VILDKAISSKSHCYEYALAKASLKKIKAKQPNNRRTKTKEDLT